MQTANDAIAASDAQASKPTIGFNEHTITASMDAIRAMMDAFDAPSDAAHMSKHLGKPAENGSGGEIVSLSPKKLADLLDLSIASGVISTAVAGWDYGGVAVWDLKAFCGAYLVMVADVGKSEFFFSETVDLDNLEKTWLEPEAAAITDPLEKILFFANLYGLSSIDRTDPDEKGPFYVVYTEDPVTPISELATSEGGDIIEFSSYKAAREWAVAVEDPETWRRRPSGMKYRIVTAA